MTLILYGCDFSPNVERVELALAHKGLEWDRVWIDLSDRSLVRAVSGQDRVPALDDDGHVVTDSTGIVRHLDRRFPERPLYPRDDPAREAEMLVFVEWFNRVWKGALNGLIDELSSPPPDPSAVAAHGTVMRRSLDLFESMLTGREFLMGSFSAADIAAYPFVGRAAGLKPDDSALGEVIMRDYQPLGNSHPRLRTWIERLDGFPAGYGRRGAIAAV